MDVRVLSVDWWLILRERWAALLFEVEAGEDAFH